MSLNPMGGAEHHSFLIRAAGVDTLYVLFLGACRSQWIKNLTINKRASMPCNDSSTWMYTLQAVSPDQRFNTVAAGRYIICMDTAQVILNCFSAGCCTSMDICFIQVKSVTPDPRQPFSGASYSKERG